MAAEFNAGSIEASLDLDRTPFTEGLRLAKAEGEDFARQRYTATLGLDQNKATYDIDALRFKLAELSAQGIHINTDVDTGAALAHLAELRLAMADINGQSLNVNTGGMSSDLNRAGDAASSFSSRLKLIAMAIAFLSPLLAPLTGEVLGLASALTVAGSGLGAFAVAVMPGIMAVTHALSLNKTAQNEAGGAASSSADQQVLAAHRVAQAEQALADARRQQAQDQADFERQLRLDTDSLARAQQTAAQAQAALTAAREAGARALQDSANKVTDAQLALRQDQIALVQAQENEARVNADSNSTMLDRQQAYLQVQQAQQALVEQQETLQRATEDNNAAQAAGVKGSQQVVSAQDKIKSAQQAVADAERKIADDRRQYARRQISDQEQIERAQESLTEAQMSAARSSDAAGGAAGRLADSLAKLSPWERQLYNQVLKLKDAFTSWGRSLEPATFPPLIAGIKMIGSVLKELSPLAIATGHALSGVVRQLDAGFHSKAFRQFIAFASSTIGPVLHSLTDTLLAFAAGIGHMAEVSSPLMMIVLKGLNNMAHGFDDLMQSPGMAHFVGFLTSVLPQFQHMLGDLFDALGNIIAATAPAAGPLIGFLDAIFTGLSTISSSLAHGGALSALATLFGTMLQVATPLVPILAELLNAAITPLAIALSNLVQFGLGPLIQIIVQNLQPMMPNVNALFVQVGRIIQNLIPLFIQLAPFINATLQALNYFIIGLTTMLGWVTALTSQFADAPSAFGVLTSAFEGMNRGVQKLADGLKSAADHIKSFFKGIGNNVKSWFGDASRWLVHQGSTIMRGLGNGISDGWRSITQFFSNVGGYFTGLWNNAGNWLVRTGRTILAGLGAGLSDYWHGTIIPFFAGVGRWFATLWTNPGQVAQWFYHIGSDLLSGLWHGINDGWNGFVNWLESMVHHLPWIVRKVLGIHSPSTVMREIGNNFGQGLYEGIRDSLANVDALVNNSAKGLAGKYDGIGSSFGAAANAPARAGQFGAPGGAGAGGAGDLVEMFAALIDAIGSQPVILALDAAGRQRLATVVKTTNDRAQSRRGA